MNFAPRAVPPSSWRRWLVLGVALTARRAGAFVAFGAVCVVVHALPADIGLGVVVVPAALGLGCLVAECADHGWPLVRTLRAKPLAVSVRLALIGLVFGLAALAVGLLVVALAGSVGVEPLAVPMPSAATARSLAEALCASWLLSAAVTLFGACVVLGFMVPLVALGELPLLEAFVQTIVAIRLNTFSIFLSVALACAAVVGLVTPFLAIPWTAIVSATLYAGYRDVFLARADNVPVRAGGAVTAPARGA